MPEVIFKPLNELIEKNQLDLAYICNPLIPATLAIWSKEANDYLYISKDDTSKIIESGVMLITSFYQDINCEKKCPLQNIPISIDKKDLIITTRAHRRLLAISIFHGKLAVSDIGYPHFSEFTKERIKHYFLKDEWQPLETALIIRGIDPEFWLNLCPTESLSYQWRNANKTVANLIYGKIWSGFYDEIPEESIIPHIDEASSLLAIGKIFQQVWSAYNIFSTWRERKPLKILDKICECSLWAENSPHASDTMHLNQLMTVIISIKNSNLKNFEEEYPALNKILESNDSNLNLNKESTPTYQQKIGQKGGCKSKKKQELMELALNEIKSGRNYAAFASMLKTDYFFEQAPTSDDPLYESGTDCDDIYLMENIMHYTLKSSSKARKRNIALTSMKR